ncbi:hypothetical protein GCM10009535_53280 [Streptomyces thermocarboxydovorans]|uniref:Secreted protein n=1 Tax=Streptomyces thermocarboxydovorans TaxID=59298 RepID=A0ABP3SWF3_9ACTN
MSTGLIIALIVIAVVLVAVAAVVALRARGPRHGMSLERRFGPEYERVVARHDGDTQAAERELADRVERHGSLRMRELEPTERHGFEARWTAAQERFVESPREALAEADRLISELAGARGFPDGGQYEEQFAALSVHHAHHVDGYRRVHRVTRARANGAADGGAGTEEMREAMVEARVLFDELLRPSRHDGGRHRAAPEREHETRSARGSHTPSLLHRRQTKES